MSHAMRILDAQPASKTLVAPSHNTGSPKILPVSTMRTVSLPRKAAIERHEMKPDVTLPEKHAGRHDEAYTQRRQYITKLANSLPLDAPVPHLQYTAEETQTWGAVLRMLRAAHSSAACRQYQRCFDLFDLTENAVPQMQELSDEVQQNSGWRIRPVGGTMRPRTFLSSFANKTLHATQFLRHSSCLSFCPEPDMCHELIGHLPLLADPLFSVVIQRIGQASMHANKAAFRKLLRVYWHTVEMGLVYEDGQVKALGAAVLSSVGEMQAIQKQGVVLKDFDPFQDLPPLADQCHQGSYYVMRSFEEGCEQLMEFCDWVERGKIN